MFLKNLVLLSLLKHKMHVWTHLCYIIVTSKWKPMDWCLLYVAQRQKMHLTLSVLCVIPVCVYLGERGTGYESIGTAWGNHPLPPGGTPSPLTSPTSPSPTTQWGMSVTPSPLSVMYVGHSALWVGVKTWITKEVRVREIVLVYVEICKTCSSTSLDWQRKEFYFRCEQHCMKIIPHRNQLHSPELTFHMNHNIIIC